MNSNHQFIAGIKNTFILSLIAVFVLSSCKDEDNVIPADKKVFGIFTITDDPTVVDMNGVIGSSTLDDFNNLYSINDKVAKINIVACDGSEDDETNLKVSKRVHDLKINTHLADNGSIASGGVDFFLAGIKRTRGTDTQIGVHSWSNGTNEATDFAQGHANHLPYIEYYVSIGFTQTDAEDFYYFTINAAPAADIHWMTDEEIAKYKMVTE